MTVKVTAGFGPSNEYISKFWIASHVNLFKTVHKLKRDELYVGNESNKSMLKTHIYWGFVCWAQPLSLPPPPGWFYLPSWNVILMKNHFFSHFLILYFYLQSIFSITHSITNLVSSKKYLNITCRVFTALLKSDNYWG